MFSKLNTISALSLATIFMTTGVVSATKFRQQLKKGAQHRAYKMSQKDSTRVSVGPALQRRLPAGPTVEKQPGTEGASVGRTISSSSKIAPGSRPETSSENKIPFVTAHPSHFAYVKENVKSGRGKDAKFHDSIQTWGVSAPKNETLFDEVVDAIVFSIESNESMISGPFRMLEYGAFAEERPLVDTVTKFAELLRSGSVRDVNGQNVEFELQKVKDVFANKNVGGKIKSLSIELADSNKIINVSKDAKIELSGSENTHMVLPLEDLITDDIRPFFMSNR